MRRLVLGPALLALAVASPPAQAAPLSVTPDGFVLRYVVTAPTADPAALYAQFSRIGDWWSGEHSYSGDAKNLSLDLKAGGCWCETWPGGSIEHARLVLAMPGRALRFVGGFGPLQALPVNAVLSVSFAEGPQGGGTMTVTYRVAGPAAAKLEALAAPVDQVLGAQMASFAARVGGQLQSAP